MRVSMSYQPHSIPLSPFVRGSQEQSIPLWVLFGQGFLQGTCRGCSSLLKYRAFVCTFQDTQQSILGDVDIKQPPQPKYPVLEGHTYVALKQITPKSPSFQMTIECGHAGTGSWNYSCFWAGLNLILQREAAVKFLRCWAYFIILTLMFKIFFLYPKTCLKWVFFSHNINLYVLSWF